MSSVEEEQVDSADESRAARRDCKESSGKTMNSAQRALFISRWMRAIESGGDPMHSVG